MLDKTFPKLKDRTPSSASDAQRPALGAAPATGIVVTSLRKHYVRKGGVVVDAIDDVSMTIEPSSFVVLLGPSGCGKTTFLRCIAGLEWPDSGEIRFGERVVFSSRERVDLPAEKRGLGMVFQSYAVWPHMTIFENVAYSLRAKKTRGGSVRRRVDETLELLGIPELAQQFPSQLSGGQQQRVALARAIVAQEGIVLFDEPLSNVDAKVRAQVVDEILAMQARVGFTAIYVTHDQSEALTLASHLAVLRAGKVVQFDAPQRVYFHPANLYVAEFVGTSNVVRGRLTRAGAGTGTVQTDFGSIEVGLDTAAAAIRVGDDVFVISRPSDWQVGPDLAGPNGWQAPVLSRSFHGATSELNVDLAGTTIRISIPGRLSTSDSVASPGASVRVGLAPDAAIVRAD